MDRDARTSIYTDGSKLGNQLGGGVFSAKLDTKNAFRLSDDKEFFVRIRGLTTRNIFIYTDSQAALKSPKSLHCHIKMQRVPGHGDIPSNCKADELVRAAD